MIDYFFNNADCIFYFFPYLFLRNIIFTYFVAAVIFFLKKKANVENIFL